MDILYQTLKTRERLTIHDLVTKGFNIEVKDLHYFPLTKAFSKLSEEEVALVFYHVNKAKYRKKEG